MRNYRTLDEAEFRELERLYPTTTNRELSKMFNISNLNSSGQWVQQSANAFIKENTFRINIGITFNEGWFAKWKVN